MRLEKELKKFGKPPKCDKVGTEHNASKQKIIGIDFFVSPNGIDQCLLGFAQLD